MTVTVTVTMCGTMSGTKKELELVRVRRWFVGLGFTGDTSGDRHYVWHYVWYQKKACPCAGSDGGLLGNLT